MKKNYVIVNSEGEIVGLCRDCTYISHIEGYEVLEVTQGTIIDLLLLM